MTAERTNWNPERVPKWRNGFPAPPPKKTTEVEGWVGGGRWGLISYSHSETSKKNSERAGTCDFVRFCVYVCFVYHQVAILLPTRRKPIARPPPGGVLGEPHLDSSDWKKKKTPSRTVFQDENGHFKLFFFCNFVPTTPNSSSKRHF